MSSIIDSPFIVFALALVVQWCAAYLGDLLRRKVRPIGQEERADFDTVLAATLTLARVIIGFTFSMAVSRYDQRKNYRKQRGRDWRVRRAIRSRCKPSCGRRWCMPARRSRLRSPR